MVTHSISLLLIDSFITRKFKNYEANKFNMDNEVLFPDLLISGRKELLQFLETKDIMELSPELIMLLDSIRAIFRFLDNQNHKMICFHFEKFLEDLNV